MSVIVKHLSYLHVVQSVLQRRHAHLGRLHWTARGETLLLLLLLLLMRGGGGGGFMLRFNDLVGT